MTDEEAAIAIMEPCRKGEACDAFIDNLEWHRLEANINGHSLNDWSHSQAALVEIARSVWLHGPINYRLFGLLDTTNRTRVLSVLAQHLNVEHELREALAILA